jgi:hypothetical protein
MLVIVIQESCQYLKCFSQPFLSKWIETFSKEGQKMFKKIFSVGWFSVFTFFVVIYSAKSTDATVINLTPNGFDDTIQLQNALGECSGATSPCKVILSEGIFYTDVLLVRDFRGRIMGQGAGQTIIRPVTDRPLRCADEVFSSDPTLEEPYPILMHFADGGDISLSDFTLEFPPEMQVEPFSTSGPEIFEDVLLSGIMGDGTATNLDLSLSGLEIIAAANDEYLPFGSNLLNAIRFEGQFRPGGMTPLHSGEFKANDTRIEGGGLGFALRDVNRVKVKIVDNQVLNSRLISVFLTDMGESDVKVQNNTMSSETVGIQIVRGFRPPSVPSDFVITNNNLVMNESGPSLFGLADGIVFADLTTEAGIDNVLIRNNSVDLLMESFEGIYVFGDRSNVKIKKNNISGSSLFAGITIDGSNGTRASNDEFENLNAELADVWLTNTTSNCVIKEPGASILDEGTNNNVETLSSVKVHQDIQNKQLRKRSFLQTWFLGF